MIQVEATECLVAEIASLLAALQAIKDTTVNGIEYRAAYHDMRRIACETIAAIEAEDWDAIP